MGQREVEQPVKPRTVMPWATGEPLFSTSGGPPINRDRPLSLPVFAFNLVLLVHSSGAWLRQAPFLGHCFPTSRRKGLGLDQHFSNTVQSDEQFSKNKHYI